MKWLRPSLLVLVSVVLAIGAAALVAGSFWERNATPRAVPLPLPEGDREIVWLHAATNTSWQRLVTAVRRVQEVCPELHLHVDEDAAFPQQTTAVPEIAVAVGAGKAKVRIRWYKLTSDLKTTDWIKALVEKRPPPLAIIGGSSSDVAIELAQDLQGIAAPLGAKAPLLLLTTATSDEVRGPDDHLVSLNGLYPGRTFRFCFTNRQMAEAVTDFLWSQDELRPDADPVYVTYWEDDPYSANLTGRFMEALRAPAVRAAVQDWAWPAGAAATGAMPIELAAVHRGQFRLSSLAVTERIPFSVGTFQRPNRWEAAAAEDLMKEVGQHPRQRRPLLILPATGQPARRFLHGLVRNAPLDAQRFVVATGDAIPFNTIYRDRNLSWPIQDLPFPLVCFCHRNPVDERAGFQPESGNRSARPNEGSPATGTEDLLLYVDIVQAIVQAARAEEGWVVNAEQLARRLSDLRVSEDGLLDLLSNHQPLFDKEGNRRDGTGEHLVYLRPTVEKGRLLPRATISVWSRPSSRGSAWQSSRTLTAEYEEATAN